MGGAASRPSSASAEDDPSLYRRRKTTSESDLLKGLFGDEDDLRAFCRLFDNPPSLRFTPSVWLAVVSEGEVVASISKGDKKVRARVFYRGQIIPFFLYGESLRPVDDDPHCTTFVFGELRLHFEAKGPLSRVLQIDKSTKMEFLATKPKDLTGLKALQDARLTPFLSSSSEMPIIDQNWGHVLAPLVDLVPFLEGDLVEAPMDAPLFFEDEERAAFKSVACPGIVVLGKCRSLGIEHNIGEVLDKLQAQHTKNGTIIVDVGPKVGKGRPRSPPALSRKNSTSRIDWDEEEGRPLGPGSTIGVQNTFLNPRKGLRSVFAGTNGVVAYFTPLTLAAIKALEPSLIKMWTDAFVSAYLLEVKAMGKPILRSISEFNVSYLASRTVVEVKAPGSVILNQGDKADAFIFIVDGLLEERIAGSKDPPRLLLPGDQYGSSSIVVNTPYRGTVSATTTSVIMTIGRTLFMQVFSQDKRYILEIKMRAGGSDAELSTVLSHAEGYKLFYNYLTKEFATENLLFWKAVEDYQERARSAFKEYVQKTASNTQRMLFGDNSINSTTRLKSPAGSAIATATATVTGTSTGSATGTGSAQATSTGSSAGLAGVSSVHSTNSAGHAGSFSKAGMPAGQLAVNSDRMSAMRDLYAAAKAICKEFINLSAENQVNIPFTERTKIEAAMADWTQKISEWEGQAAPDADFSLDSSVYSIFSVAQKDIYAFTSRDAFTRWKKEPEFDAFIRKIRDADNVTNVTKLREDGRRVAGYRSSYTRQDIEGELQHVVSLGVTLGGSR